MTSIKNNLLGLFTTAVILTSCGAETSDREKSAGAFEDNFGFKPPESVKEIKHKNYIIYDSFVHWMAFTYDSVVFNKILVHDQPLDTAYVNTPEYNEMTQALEKGCANCPNWFKLPSTNTSRIYFKKDFLKHTSSEYHLWVDVSEKMVYLEVSYFD